MEEKLGKKEKVFQVIVYFCLALSLVSTISYMIYTILASNNISAIEKISGLKNLTKLNISVNTSFTDFGQVKSFTNLQELNVSGTGITNFEGIKELSNIEKLYAADNKEITSSSGLSPLFETYYDSEDYTTKPYLEKIKVLNLSSIGISGRRPSISFYNFGYLTTLEEIHLASNEMSDIYGITNLVNLKYIDGKTYVFLNECDVTDFIRTNEVSRFICIIWFYL